MNEKIKKLALEISKELAPHESIIITYDQIKMTTDEWGMPIEMND